jgi:fibronectin type 3 domain-containing protein
MTFVTVTEKHTEEESEKKEKKPNFGINSEMMGAFDGIDSDLRLDMILNGRG